MDGVEMRTRWDPAAQRLRSVWINRRGGRRRNESAIRVYTPAQMRELFEDAGLRVIRMYGSFLGNRCHRGTNRMIVVGRKR